jgi:nitrile hydratase accessory protein
LNSSNSPKDFSEPWQAEAYSMVQALIEGGRITRTQWSSAFGRALRQAADRGEVDNSRTYYAALADALGKVLVTNGLLEPCDIERRVEDWREAYRHTPHGKPVVLGSR